MTSTTYADWDAIAPIAIANAPGVDDYPVRVNLTWLDDDNGTMNADFSDIRFIDASDNALSYWIESKTDSTSAVVWVKVASGAEAISVVYGNTEATSESDGEDVFDLFDDFSTLDTERWTVLASGAGVSVSDGTVTVAPASSSHHGIVSKAAFGLGTAVRSLCTLGTVSCCGRFGYLKAENVAQWIAQFANGPADVSNSTNTRSDGAYTETKGTLLPNTASVFEARRPSAGLVTFHVDGSTVATHTKYTANNAYAVGLTGTQSTSVTYADWVLVRKCQATEPVCTVGDSEANAGGPVAPAPREHAPYHEWPYSLEYAVTNPHAEAGAYAVPLTVAWKPGMRQDFRDLRFRDEGMIPLTHRLEFYTAGTTATFLLEIRPGQERLSVLYGNGAAVSASDETFCPVLDAFSGAAVDTAIWTDLGGTAVSGGALTVTGDGTDRYVESVDTFDIGSAVRIRCSSSPAGGLTYAGFTNAAGTLFAAVAYGPGSDTAITSALDDSTSTTVALDAGYHTIEVARTSETSVVFSADGAIVATHTTDIPPGAIPIAVGAYNVGDTIAVDWVTVRPCLAIEPTITYLSADCNPWSPLVNRSSALFDVPFDWSDFTQQKIISFTVRRSAADAMYRAEVQIEGLIPQGTDYQQVHLLVPDHRDPEILNRIFYGFLPAQTSRMAVAANKTSYSGYSYDFYLSSMKVNPAALVMPSTTNPATWIASAVGVGADEVFPTHDVTNVHAPAAWGTDAMPAREFVIPSGSSRWQAYQKVADELGLILAGKWLDAGSTPTYNHQDPALRIIRVEAEDYDAGGEGVGYHDTTAANLGGAYRKDGVDIEYFASEAGYNVGWIRDGEWLRYTVAIPVAGNWTARFRTASAAPSPPNAGARSFKVYWGTNPASLTEIDDIAVDGTGSYSSFVWNTDEATLPVVAGGTHYLKLLFDNAGDDVADLLHMNIAAIDLHPPPGAGAAENIVPALYLCDEADIDGPNGLDLPPTAVIPVYDPTLAGEVRYVEDFGAVANVVVIQYRTPAAPDDIVSYTVYPEDLTPPQTSTLEGWIDHYEEIRTPITAAVAEAYGKALLASLLESWGTVTANFVKRSDLQLFQKIRFEGHENIPEIDYRIVDISCSVALADVRCSITAIPARKFSVEKQLARTRAPDPATEIEAIARSVLKTLPPALTGTAGSAVGTGSVAVALDRGGTITARGVAASGSRVICTWAEGIGYVASVIAAAA